MTYDPSKVAFVDIETTGLDPEYDAIWEIGVIVDDQPVVWQQLLTDRQVDNVHPDAARITGFHTRYKPDEALTPARSIRRLMSLVGDRHMVGACPWFDSERLHRLILRDRLGDLTRGLPWHYHLVDVENLAVGFLMARGEWEKMPFPWKSRDLAKMLGVDQDQLREEWGQEHSALADAEFARRMFEAVAGPPEIEYR
jgi:DNA polymerase III epsilon subunit-like protein